MEDMHALRYRQRWREAGHAIGSQCVQPPGLQRHFLLILSLQGFCPSIVWWSAFITSFYVLTDVEWIQGIIAFTLIAKRTVHEEGVKITPKRVGNVYTITYANLSILLLYHVQHGEVI